MNLNKDYIITVDVKNATVIAPGKMNFYITDIKTANIFAQLVVNESESSLIKNYAPVENAQDFEITLRVIKPNNQFMETKFALLNQLEAFFMVDLTDEYKDYIGTYKCELFVDCTVNGELERITTASFRYKVLASIANSLDEVIEGDPDYPLVDEILERMEAMDPENFATPDYVDSKIENFIVATDVPGIIDSYLGGTPNSYDNIKLTAPFKMKVKTDSPLDIRTVVDTESDIMNIEYPYVGMVVYVRDTGKRYEILTLAPKQVGLADIQDACVGTYRELDYATTEYVDEAVANVEDCNIQVIGNGEETLILTPDDVEADITALWILNNVSIGGNTYDGGLFSVATWMNGDYKCIEFMSIYGEWMVYQENDNGEFELTEEDYFAYESSLENKADKEHTHDEYATTEHTHDDLVVDNSITVGDRKADTKIGGHSVAIGGNVEASGHTSFAMGLDATASGVFSYAQGNFTIASGSNSHAEGQSTTASNMASHAEGRSTTASGKYSHTEGYYATASGNASHAEGCDTLASSEYQHVQGKYNIEDTAKTYAHIVGNGNSDTDRKNAHTLDWDGNAWFAGEVTVGADNKVLATESYVDEAVVNAGGVIQVIGGEEETHIFTPDDIPDDSEGTYLFKNVMFPYFNSNGNKVGHTYDYCLMTISAWLDEDTKYMEMIDNAWGHSYGFYTNENNELVLDWEDFFVFSTELNEGLMGWNPNEGSDNCSDGFFYWENNELYFKSPDGSTTYKVTLEQV